MYPSGMRLELFDLSYKRPHITLVLLIHALLVPSFLPCTHTHLTILESRLCKKENCNNASKHDLANFSLNSYLANREHSQIRSRSKGGEGVRSIVTKCDVREGGG